MDVLGRAGATSGGGEGFAIVNVMSLASALKTKSFLKALSTFDRSEFCDGDGVNIHCIGVFLGVRNKG